MDSKIEEKLFEKIREDSIEINRLKVKLSNIKEIIYQITGKTPVDNEMIDDIIKEVEE